MFKGTTAHLNLSGIERVAGYEPAFESQGDHMKYARFEVAGKSAYGIVEGDEVRELSGSPLKDHSETGAVHRLADVRLLAPIPRPGKIMAMALNYYSHLHGAPPPSRPEPFYKTGSSVVGPGDTVVLPLDFQHVDMEAELVVVIGKNARNVSEADALDYVFGYTCGNDVSEREWQSGASKDIQWWRAKSADTFSPIGPVIETDLDPTDVQISGRVNGAEGQSCHTSEMIFNVVQAISFISKYVTLEPGDLIFTGTAGAPPGLKSGDVTEVEIAGIGTLTNPVE